MITPAQRAARRRKKFLWATPRPISPAEAVRVPALVEAILAAVQPHAPTLAASAPYRAFLMRQHPIRLEAILERTCAMLHPRQATRAAA